ncbi:MAG: TPM domain-containing protein [Candidatus Eremiobacteraeota bacterium]|nr:TPM domain-containing protein [Candidatus Eremiobacteraeota bacterium]
MTARCGKAFFLIVLFAALILSSESAALPLPPPPGREVFTVDDASLIKKEDLEKITAIQKDAYTIFDTSLMVVTIPTMSLYDGTGAQDFQQFARQWFEKWKVGKIDAHGNRLNSGILILLSKAEQKFSIQRGDGWVNGWDPYIDYVLKYEMGPSFRKNDFSKGILRGVQALNEMIKVTTRGAPRKPDTAQLAIAGLAEYIRHPPFSVFGEYTWIALIVAFIFILTAFIYEKGSAFFFGTGFLIACLAIFYPVFIIAGVILVALFYLWMYNHDMEHDMKYHSFRFWS